MKRAVCKLCVFIVLGAVVNVAVVWGCALWIRADSWPFDNSTAGGSLEQTSGYQWWSVYLERRNGSCTVTSAWIDPDVSISLSGGFPDEQPAGPLIPSWADAGFDLWPPHRPISTGQEHCRIADARGWPWLSLSWAAAADYPSSLNSAAARIAWGIALEPLKPDRYQGMQDARVLPLRPMWPGFLLGTAVYGAALRLAVYAACAPIHWMRRRRSRRGFCPHCSYPIGTSPVCTECGKPVKPKAETAA